MEQKLAACGNDCAACPRHLPRDEASLRHTAELWMKIGYRDTIVSCEEIACSGCKAGNWCRYRIIDCVTTRGIEHCGACPDYPCAHIQQCFEATQAFAPACRQACTPAEYQALHQAFFCKKENLNHAQRRRAMEDSATESAAEVVVQRNQQGVDLI